MATIRKGTPKRKIEKVYNGVEKDRGSAGVDLKNKFRIDFLPGTKRARDSWHSLHDKEYIKYPATSCSRWLRSRDNPRHADDPDRMGKLGMAERNLRRLRAGALPSQTATTTL